ncbi:actin family [Zopfochytrium polystomum]|nr:actin family [Zopfochytrium polystomum]
MEKMVFGIGDDVSALIFDIGTSTSKAGYAGEDTPRAVFPSAVGSVAGEGGSGGGGGAPDDGQSAEPAPQSAAKKYVGDSQVYLPRANMDIKFPLVDGLVEDWDTLETLWSYSYRDRLRADPTQHPLLVVEPSWNPREKREKLLELAFEGFHVPAFYLGRSAALTAYTAGRATALVVECGAGVTSAVPVLDGFVLKKGIQRTSVAGNAVSQLALSRLEAQGVSVVPHYLVAKKNPVDAGVKASFVKRDVPGVTDSFHRFCVERALTEYKETVCQVSEHAFNEAALAARPGKVFEFPDGYNTSFGVERFKAPELLFNTTLDPSHSGKPPIQQLLPNAWNACDPDVRPSLVGNIVISGGSTLFPGFVERMHHTMIQVAAPMKCKIHASALTTERKYGAWIGGSILASLGTFHQMWVSKEEYFERGSGVEKRLV